MLALSGCSRRSGEELSGRWQGKMTLPETGRSLTDLEVDLTRAGTSVAGTMNFKKVPNGLLPVKGELAGEKLTLNSDFKSGLKVTFSGTRQGPRLIKGTALLDYNAPRVGTKQDRVEMVLSR
jgi:uncharacterized protein YigE (DUF2233 family)